MNSFFNWILSTVCFDLILRTFLRISSKTAEVLSNVYVQFMWRVFNFRSNLGPMWYLHCQYINYWNLNRRISYILHLLVQVKFNSHCRFHILISNIRTVLISIQIAAKFVTSVLSNSAAIHFFLQVSAFHALIGHRITLIQLFDTSV